MSELVLVEKKIPVVVTVGIQGPAGPATSSLEKTAGEILGAHRALIIDYDDKAYYASNDNPGHVHKVIGISTNAAELDEAINIITTGELEDVSFNFQENKPIYVGVDGALTQSVPEDGFMQQIATAITATKIFVQLKQVIQLT